MRKLPTVVFFLLASIASAQDRGVTFAVGEWPPYVGEGLPGNGAAAEIVSAACREAGLRAVFVFYPWIRAEARAAEGRDFGTFPFIRIPERERDFLFSDPIFKSSIRIVRYADSRRAEAVRFEGDLAVFNGFSIGATAGAKAILEPFKRAGLIVEETRTPDQSFVKLEKGRIDFVVEERVVALDVIKRLYPDKIEKFRFLERSFSGESTYRVLVSKSFPDAQKLLDRFNEGLRRIRANGTLKAINTKYGIPD